ncbi:MAG: trigger factor [Christensenellaceae bacterium]
MSAVCEKTGTNEVRLTITVSAADFEEAMNKAYLKARKSINIPGFRKGKAPRKVIENFYSEAVFYEDAFDLVFPKAYDDAIVETGIYPVDRPSVDVTTIGGGEDLVFTCDVTVKPEVKLGSYKGIEATRPEYNVTDDDVEDELKKDQERVARWITVEDRAVENGDRITLDYAGFCDGEQFPGGTATDQTLEVGSGRFIPGFEEQLVGMKLEEEGTVNVTFPAEYHAPDLAGKDAIFNVKIHKIEVKELPEMDDEFAKDVSDCDTLEDYKAKIRERLEKTAETRAKNELDEQLVNAVVEASEVEIPECMVNSQLDYMLQEMEYRMMYQGISMEDYTRMTGQTRESIREENREEAGKIVKRQLVLEALQKDAGLEVSDEELDAEIAKMATETRTVEDIKKTLRDSDYDYLKGNVLLEKTLQLLEDNAVIG